MFLSKLEIEKLIDSKELAIHPFNPEMIKPSSYTFTNNKDAEIQPKQFLVIESLESIVFPNNVGGILSTRGSIAKLGLDCLMTDTVIEPGSTGKLTFCAINHSNEVIKLTKGTPIVKCLFYNLG